MEEPVTHELTIKGLSEIEDYFRYKNSYFLLLELEDRLRDSYKYDNSQWLKPFVDDKSEPCIKTLCALREWISHTKQELFSE